MNSVKELSGSSENLSNVPGPKVHKSFQNTSFFSALLLCSCQQELMQVHSNLTL